MPSDAGSAQVSAVYIHLAARIDNLPPCPTQTSSPMLTYYYYNARNWPRDATMMADPARLAGTDDGNGGDIVPQPTTANDLPTPFLLHSTVTQAIAAAPLTRTSPETVSQVLDATPDDGETSELPSTTIPPATGGKVGGGRKVPPHTDAVQHYSSSPPTSVCFLAHCLL